MELAWNAQKNQLSDVKGKEMEQERKGKISNEDIDLDRTHQNYDLVESDETLYQRVKNRVDDLKENGSRVQKNSVVMYSNILTVSEQQAENWGEQKTQDYFKACYEFFCDEFGRENVVSAKVHKDETTPHMHLHFVPVNKENGKLQARISMNKAKINFIHDELPKFLRERGFDVVRASGKTKENNIENIHEFKQVKREIADKQNELNQLDERIEFKKRFSQNISPMEFKLTPKNEIKTEVIKKGFGRKDEIKEVKTGNIVLPKDQFNRLVDISNRLVSIQHDYKELLNTDYVKENQELRKMILDELKTNDRLREENQSLKSTVSHLKAEITELYETTKSFLKERTNDFETLQTHLKAFVGKLKAKIPQSVFGRLHDAENAFNVENLKRMDKQINQSQPTKKKSRGMER